jgi:hypothetical protein
MYVTMKARFGSRSCVAAMRLEINCWIHCPWVSTHGYKNVAAKNGARAQGNKQSAPHPNPLPVKHGARENEKARVNLQDNEAERE